MFRWLIYVPRTFHLNTKVQEKIEPSQMISCRWFYYYISDVSPTSLISQVIKAPCC